MIRFALTAAVVVLMACAAADPQPRGQESEARVEPAGTVTIIGTVTNEGVECPAIRTAQNELYTIAGGDRTQLRPGVRVRVTGTVTEISFCMQGTTISPTKIEVLP